MIKTEFKPGDLKTLDTGAVPPDLGLSGVDLANVKVVGMEHRYGYNRFVMVELGNEEKTRMIVRPGDLS